MIKAFVFDFGGVLAEEGFREGLRAIGAKNGLDPEDFFEVASELVYETGYVTGMSGEPEFWQAVRAKTGITASDEELRGEILARFRLRPDILKIVEDLKCAGMMTAILSDQTNWLSEINRKTPFYHYFDYVFNSFDLRKGKRDQSVFRDICSTMGVGPGEALFIDDNGGNIKRAEAEGLRAIHYKDKGAGGLKQEIERKIRENRQSGQ